MNDEAGARRALWIFGALLALAQPVSLLLGTSYLERWGSDGNAYNQWHAYRNSLSPAMVFVGDSRVRLGIDTAELSRALGVPVDSIGIDAAKPKLLRAVVERLVSSAQRPRTVILALSEYQLNATWMQKQESGGAQSNYYWQLGSPVDPRFALTALTLNQEPARLVAGWALPLLANYPVIVQGVRCDLAALRRRTDCFDEYALRDRRMDAATLNRWHRIVRDDYLGQYAIDQEQAEATVSSIRRLREHAIEVRVLILPSYQAETLAPAEYGLFLRSVAQIARDLNVEVIDLHDTFADRPDLFFDPNHLTGDGARQLAARLTEDLKGLR